MIDIEDLIKGLDGFILSVSSGKGNTRTRDRRTGLIGVDVSLKVRPLELEADPPLAQPTAYHGVDAAEPLIDVLEDERSLRVIALLPGIRKEDVRYRFRDGFLELEIFRDCTYRKEIPCSAQPEQISVKSTTLNNSVLEVVFAKNINNERGLV